MSDKEKNINYTARDIEQYLAGNLLPQQMHAMEKAALDDPFLSEAMEGYEGVKDKEWNNQLVALRLELSKKGITAKVIPLHKSKNNWRKIAAAVLIIGSGTTLTFIFNRNKKDESDKQQIAQTITVYKDSASPIEIPAPTSVTQSLNPNASATREDKKTIPGTAVTQIDRINARAQENIILEPGAPVLKPSSPAAAPIAADDKAVVTSSAAANSPANENAEPLKDEKNKTASKQAETDVGAARQRSESNVAKKEAVLNNFFTAQVVAADNTPLPFTNISIKKENFGTYADAKGMVRLVSTDSVLNIEVKSVGYLAKTFALRSNQVQTKIVLQEEEVALKDRKVIGNAARKSSQPSHRARLLKDSAVNVEPADGWENYNTYVANNLDIPEASLMGDQHGEVEISFDVKSNGTISNIRINKSLGAEYDEAAKRLIKEGPQWKVKKGKKTSANVKVQF